MTFDTRLKHIARRAKQQLILYITHHIRRSRSRQRQYRHIRIHLSQISNLQIRRTKIITPFRNTVCLIYGNKAKLKELQTLDKQLRLQPLRRNIQHLKRPILSLLQYIKHLVAIHSSMYYLSANTTFLKVLYLVRHQRNKRRHNQSHTIHSQRRHLIRNRLTTTRWQYRKRINSRPNALDNIQLQRSKILITPIFL